MLFENATIIDLELAKEIKAEGNDLFRAKEYQEALGVYSKAYSCVPPNEKEFQSILLGNRAACLARLVTLFYNLLSNLTIIENNFE